MKDTRGYIKDGEVMFVSVKHSNYSVVLDVGGPQDRGGSDKKPRFADFTPGFAGGEFRVNAKTAKRAHMSIDDLLENLRGRDVIDKEFCEVKNSDHLAELVAAREAFVKDEGDHEVVVRGAPKAAPVPQKPEPIKTEPSVPLAAKGPGRPRRAAAV